MLPATIWVNPPTAISHVIRVMTWNCAPSAPGISQTMAAIRNPAAIARNTISHQLKASRSRLISEHSVVDVARQNGRERAEQCREQSAGKIGREHDRPKPRHAQDIAQRHVGGDGQNRGDRAFGEQLLAREHRHDKSDAVAEADHERLPGCLRQVCGQDRLRQQRETDREPGRDARPPQRSSGALHFFFAKSAHHLVDHRRARSRQLLDVLDLFRGDAAPAAAFRRLGRVIWLAGCARAHDGQQRRFHTQVPPMEPELNALCAGGIERRDILAAKA